MTQKQFKCYHDSVLNCKTQCVQCYQSQQHELHGGITQPTTEGSGIQIRTFLFLDDIREPEDAFAYTGLYFFKWKNWVIVRNFDEFKTYIETNGMPHFISFDHDLADGHYAPPDVQSDYEKWKAWEEAQEHKEKTGYDCALWLVDYCMDNNADLPAYFCHSMNPVGRDKILGLFRSFKEKR